MKKFTYKVTKQFALNQETYTTLGIKNFRFEIKDSHFEIGDIYVDYDSEDRDVNITSITDALVDNGFIELESQKNV